MSHRVREIVPKEALAGVVVAAIPTKHDTPLTQYPLTSISTDGNGHPSFTPTLEG